MKLSQARVQHYRPIVDSGTVDIEEGVTVVIGKNEQGKTNFLRGIRSFNSDQQFAASDLPNHLRPALEDRPAAEIPIITLTFSLDSSDSKKLAGVVNGLVSAVGLKCTKYYDNHYQFWILSGDGTEAPLEFVPPDISGPAGQIKQTLADLKVKLQAHGQRVPAFTKSFGPRFL